MTHIVHLITGLEVGGAEMTLARLVERLDPARFQSTVVSLAPEGSLAARIRAVGVPVHSLGMGRNSVFALGGAVKLWKLLRVLKPDILQTWLYHADFLGLVVGRLVGVRPILWNLRCADMDLSRYAVTTSLAIAGLARLSRWPDAVIANSQAGRDWHERLGYHPRRWVVIANGFDTERFKPRPEARERLRAELGIGERELVIGTVSRFDPMKDPHAFLKAAAMLALRRADVHFVMVGRGLEAGNRDLTGDGLSAGLGRQLHLLGQRDDVPELLAGFELFTLTSRSEGFPNALGEAMASGLACVATDVGDVRLLLGDTGRIVARGDPAAMGQAWQDLLATGPAARAALGARARARIEAEFSLTKAVGAYESLYAEMARQ